MIIPIWKMADGEAWRIAGLQDLFRRQEELGLIRIIQMDNQEAEIVAFGEHGDWLRDNYNQDDDRGGA